VTEKTVKRIRKWANEDETDEVSSAIVKEENDEVRSGQNEGEGDRPMTESDFNQDIGFDTNQVGVKKALPKRIERSVRCGSACRTWISKMIVNEAGNVL
jgi:hypothetical protein